MHACTFLGRISEAEVAKLPNVVFNPRRISFIMPIQPAIRMPALQQRDRRPKRIIPCLAGDQKIIQFAVKPGSQVYDAIINSVIRIVFPVCRNVQECSVKTVLF